MSPTASSTIRIELLGLPRLVFPDRSKHVLERRDAALLAWLALEGPTPRGHIVSLLWPDLPTRTAQTNLRQRLFRLKQRSVTEIVVAEAALALADGVRHDLAVTLPSVEAVLAAVAPKLLGSLTYDDCEELASWVESRRERLVSEWCGLLAQHAAELESSGRVAEALAFAQRLTAEMPTAEHAHRRVMRLHYQRGDRSAAMAAFQRCLDALERDLGTQPGVETRELAALIERSGELPPAIAAPSPITTLRPPKLIGREPEWQAIESAWQRRQAVLLLGEPGVGKSRLAADFGSAQNEPNVHRAHLGDTQLPYSLLTRLLRRLTERFGTVPQSWILSEFTRLMPEAGAQPEGKLQPMRMRRAVFGAMGHWETQGLNALVIDDLHFADDASLEILLAWLSEATRPQILLTSRANAVPACLHQWLRENEGEGIHEVILLPLNAEAVAHLLDSLGIPGLEGGAWSGPLMRHTGGNPFFVLETLKGQLSNAASIARASAVGLVAPPNVERMLERRLSRLAPDALRLARLAALASTDFSVKLAAQVLECHALDLAETWRELERAQIISEGGFAHDLILEATLRTVPGPIAMALHHAIAEALEIERVPPARIAHHWRAAREWARAAPQFEFAAKDAHLATRPAESLALWDAATECHGQGGSRESAFRTRSEAVVAAIAVEAPGKVKARAQSLLSDSRTDPERLLALIAMSRHTATGADYRGTLPFTAEALNIAKALEDRPRELVVAGLHGAALTATGRHAEGLAIFEGLVECVDQTGDKNIECEFCSTFSHALQAVGRVREAASWAERAVLLAERLGETNEQAINMGNLAVFRGLLGQHERALETALRAQALQDRLGEVHGEPYAISLLNVGMFYLTAGRFGEALSSYLRALSIAREGDAVTLAFVVEGHLANVYLALGQPARARQAMSPLTDAATVAVRIRRAILEWRIESFASGGNPRRLQQVLATMGLEGEAMSRFMLELTIAAALPAQESLPWSRRVRDEALAGGRPAVALTALALLTRAQHRLGLHSDAAASAAAAMAEAGESSWFDMPVPEFWWIAFSALDAAGHVDPALQALRQGVRWLTAAMAHVPDEFRDSYLHRSHAVPDLMAMSKRRLVS